MSDPYNHAGVKFCDSARFPSLAAFMERIERTFWCMRGPPKACFELPSGDVDADGDTHVARMIYETIAYTVNSGLCDDVVEDLCKKAWDEVFAPALAKMTEFGGAEFREDRALFWRKEPVVGQQNDGQTVLRMRCVIPGVRLVSYARLAAVA